MRTQLTCFNVNTLIKHLQRLSQRGRIRIMPYQYPGAGNMPQIGTLSVSYVRSRGHRSIALNLDRVIYSAEVKAQGYRPDPTIDMDCVSSFELGLNSCCIWVNFVNYGEAWLHIEVVK